MFHSGDDSGHGFWIGMLCSDTIGYQCFGWPCCFHLQCKVKIKAAKSSKMLVSYHITTWCHNP